jgi:hypothetical protein
MVRGMSDAQDKQTQAPQQVGQGGGGLTELLGSRDGLIAAALAAAALWFLVKRK